MVKDLSDMSLKELWQLFPIFLVEHKEEWEDWYEEEFDFIKDSDLKKRIIEGVVTDTFYISVYKR